MSNTKIMSVFPHKISIWDCGKILIVILGILLTVYTVLSVSTTHVNFTVTRQNERLAKPFVDLEHRILFNNLSNFGGTTENIVNNPKEIDHIIPKEEPNVDYEKLRRRIASNTEEFWYFFKSELIKLQEQTQNKTPEQIEPINRILNLGLQHKRSLLKDINKLVEVDGHAAWREKEAYYLSDLVQRRLKFLQNPPNCSSARKLICSLDSGGCGYGCTIHHLVNCLMVAYGTERTLLIKSKGWRYHKAGWEEIYKPLSESCTDPGGQSQSKWPGKSDTQVISLPLTYSMEPRPPYLPLAVPEDLAPRLIRLHSDPFLWWVGQLLKYLLRPQPDTWKFLNESTSKMGFKRPIVGVHIRRTDKLKKEAAFHALEEYMIAVEEYYKQLELTESVTIQRRIYLASDEPKVFTEAKKNYPQYEIIGDPTIAKTAAVSSRYKDTSSLRGIILDIHLLSMSDYLVCTFSSNVCRLAYEIMQNFYSDASSRFHSLDSIYSYGGGTSNKRSQIAVIAHKPNSKDEMELIPGDQVTLVNVQWNIYRKGKNLRTKVVGLYPGYKVENLVEVVKFPTYPEVPLKPPTLDNLYK